MENENVGIVILSICALVIALGAVGYVVLKQPDKVDLSEALTGINGNKILINALQTDVSDLQSEVDGIEILDISYIDLKRLDRYASDFQYIDDNREDIDDLEDKCCVDGEQGIQGLPGSDANCTELRDELCEWYPYPFCPVVE